MIWKDYIYSLRKVSYDVISLKKPLYVNDIALSFLLADIYGRETHFSIVGPTYTPL